MSHAESNPTIWEAEEHTLAKHLILKNYLEAWFPILAKWHGRIVYYDGFAGPGRYRDGQEGSPLIALRVAQAHKAKLSAELVFVFIESDGPRAAHLRSEIDQLSLPANFKCEIREQEFEAALSSTLDDLVERGLELAPTFAFIDPFGITGLPFNLIQRLLRQQRCEVLITFMSHVMERWATELPAQIDRLIGKEGAAEDIANSPARATRARELYAESLGRTARFVRFFHMKNKMNRPIYDLFFATHHALGHYRMKEAMWRADRTGNFSFSDGIDPRQATLFSENPGADFASTLAQHFKGKTAYSDEVLKYTRDDTPYLEMHAKQALKLLESEAGFQGYRIQVDEKKVDGARRKKNTYPPGTRITFLAD